MTIAPDDLDLLPIDALLAALQRRYDHLIVAGMRHRDAQSADHVVFVLGSNRWVAQGLAAYALHYACNLTDEACRKPEESL